MTTHIVVVIQQNHTHLTAHESFDQALFYLLVLMYVSAMAIHVVFRNCQWQQRHQQQQQQQHTEQP